MGMHRYENIVECPDEEGFLERVKGRPLIGVERDHATSPLWTAELPRDMVFLFGSEDSGIPAGLLDSRKVDTLVLLLAPGTKVQEPWNTSRFARGVEAWVATAPGMEEQYRVKAAGAMPHLRYLILSRETGE